MVRPRPLVSASGVVLDEGLTRAVLFFTDKLFLDWVPAMRGVIDAVEDLVERGVSFDQYCAIRPKICNKILNDIRTQYKRRFVPHKRFRSGKTRTRATNQAISACQTNLSEVVWAMEGRFTVRFGWPWLPKLAHFLRNEVPLDVPQAADGPGVSDSGDASAEGAAGGAARPRAAARPA